MTSRASETVGVPHAVAVLSTTRGSGATLLTAAAGLIVDEGVGRLGQSVILMDADLDGGGLTQLTRSWNAMSDAPVDGLLGFAEDTVGLDERSVARRLRHVRTGGGLRQDMVLFPLGPGEKPGERLPADGTLEAVAGTSVERLMELGGCLLVDCGAGRTAVTLEVCRRVEHLVLIGQPEPADSGETAELMAWLDDRGLGGKTLGLVCNSPRGGFPTMAADPAGTGAPLVRLPYDPAAAEAVRSGRAPGGESPLGRGLGTLLRARWPDVLNTGGRVAG
ncbi:MinD/ParA family protein [Streptomyces sp. NPDC056568]|uniref:MinD/ParA family ATP-binding protein n=1 Tax=Streptomyces sp. NPDC056568 TaxID=3345866 RepID=UPI00367C63EA